MQNTMGNFPSWRLFQEYWESEGLRNVVIEGAIGGIIGGIILGLVIGIILCLCLRYYINNISGNKNNLIHLLTSLSKENL